MFNVLHIFQVSLTLKKLTRYSTFFTVYDGFFICFRNEQKHNSFFTWILSRFLLHPVYKYSSSFLSGRHVSTIPGKPRTIKKPIRKYFPITDAHIIYHIVCECQSIFLEKRGRIEKKLRLDADLKNDEKILIIFLSRVVKTPELGWYWGYLLDGSKSSAWAWGG